MFGPGSNSNFQNRVTVANDSNFNVHMSNLNFRSNVHDMRDLMKSLNHEGESMLHASRSNFNLNRSIIMNDPAQAYTPYSSSLLKVTGGGGLP